MPLQLVCWVQEKSVMWQWYRSSAIARPGFAKQPTCGGQFRRPGGSAEGRPLGLIRVHLHPDRPRGGVANPRSDPILYLDSFLAPSPSQLPVSRIPLPLSSSYVHLNAEWTYRATNIGNSPLSLSPGHPSHLVAEFGRSAA